MSDETLLTVDETAQALRQSRPTIYRKVANGELRAFRLGKLGPLRIPASELQLHLHRRVPVQATGAAPAAVEARVWGESVATVEACGHSGGVQ
jgi:excisionase family DNA binding protein